MVRLYQKFSSVIPVLFQVFFQVMPSVNEPVQMKMLVEIKKYSILCVTWVNMLRMQIKCHSGIWRGRGGGGGETNKQTNKNPHKNTKTNKKNPNKLPKTKQKSDWVA